MLSGIQSVWVLVGLAVGAGWITAGQANTYTVGATVLGLVVSVSLTWWTRTPAARPRDADGTPLVPAPPPTRLAE
ncbi:hypothetical protein [Saccharopolyspora phatthalungensis]|uniref:Uncharacterized protein n=1 Tax=Saccharopolyspora phatthalungensis TaxID=664693 RepID=A0A840PW16_9PSEU|nr:hypothetical protein [Saccharopolyspora phatthalungensis]MBB5152516.1 hypothetical protein [Saccharopolyspora phatthalungensis]